MLNSLEFMQPEFLYILSKEKFLPTSRLRMLYYSVSETGTLRKRKFCRLFHK